MAEQDLRALFDLQNAHIRRRQQLLLRQAREGYSTPPEVINEIEDINKEIDDIQLKISSEKSINSGLRSSVVKIISRRISHVSILIDNWEVLFNTIKYNADRIVVDHVSGYIRFLRDRRDQLDNLLDSTNYCEDFFLYSRRLLFMYCDMQNKADVLSYSKDIGHDEFVEMLRDARFCLIQAEQGGLQKGLIYFYLASISYELKDDSPEIVYEYCMKALDKKFDYPELQDVLFFTCKILSGYPGQYYDGAKRYLSTAKKRRKKLNTSPPFCPNSYTK